MRRSRRVKWLGLLVALSTGAFPVGAGGCAEYYATAALSAIDLCSVFNCEEGTFFSLCYPVPLLADCPNIE